MYLLPDWPMRLSSVELLGTPELAFLQFLIPALLGAAGSIGGGLINRAAQSDANRTNMQIASQDLGLNWKVFHRQGRQLGLENRLAREAVKRQQANFNRQMRFSQQGRDMQRTQYGTTMDFLKGQAGQQQRNFERQLFREDRAIRRRVADARAAGLHPLAALGGAGHSGAMAMPVGSPGGSASVGAPGAPSFRGSGGSAGSGFGSRGAVVSPVTGVGDAVASAFDNFGRIMAAKQQLQASEASQIRIARERHRLGRERMQEALTLIPATSRSLTQRARQRAEDGSRESRLIFEGEPRGVELHTGFRKTMPPKTENMGMYDEMNDFIDRAAQDVARDVRGVVSDMRKFRESMAAKRKRRRNRKFGSGRGNF